MRRIVCVLIIAFQLNATQSFAQTVYSIHTVWDDTFMEWEIFAEEDEEIGVLNLKWPLSNDWTEWSFRFNEISGVFQQQWKDNPNVWELRGDNEVINIRTRWNNDFSEWKLSSANLKITLRSRYSNQLNEWYVVGKKYGNFEMVSEYERDPRDWQVYDELNEEVSTMMRLALSFVVIANSTPKI